MAKLKIALAQINTLVGDVPGNARQIIAAIESARDTHGADLIVFQELALSGYPPEDLLFHQGLRYQLDDAMVQVTAAATGITVLVGYPEYAEECLYNAAAVLADGALQANYRKWLLPNYSVFDEQRYFKAGTEPLVIDIGGTQVGILVCEDIWTPAASAASVAAGAEVCIVLNGSPYEGSKQAHREALLADRARELKVPFIYQNMVGGQDELVFDGGSFAVNRDGSLGMRAPSFVDGIFALGLDISGSPQITDADTVPLQDSAARIYAAIVLGVRDYVRKNGFDGVVLGLSGGIDSALCLAIAVDALGVDAVQVVMMQYRYTSGMSMEDARTQAEALGIVYHEIPIEPMVNATNHQLQEIFAGLGEDATEENIQARSRGILLMAISNKTGRMVLTTGNKSEMAVGYATLYGDMAGGFAPIKDCTKTQVYELARYRNTVSPVIPERVISRAPSAELRPDQKDSDSLPDYATLDAILDALIVEDCSVDEIAARGFDRKLVGEILSMVRRNEYKRRQSPPGVRISGRAFGRDWRYPITSGYGRKH
ncbi:MAG: NAD+ synthase [Gammaproteobacteria bacterium]|nr:NAD+ synthase [Gammaproteobacteria bacterium]